MTNKQVRRQVGRVLTKYEPKKDSWPALLGNGRGTVSVAGRPGWVYVRTGSDELPGQAFNNRVPLHDDLPIIVGYDSLQPELFQVLTIREVYAGAGSGDNAIPQVVAHHGTHEFGADEGGGDVVWVQKQQIVPMLATPTSPNTMMINVYADLYPWGTGWNWFAGALSADLTARIAAAAGEAKYVLVSIDGATNALQYTDGTDFIILLPPVDMGDLIPEPPAGSVPVVAVYLPNGVTSLGWDNLFDVRLFNQPMGGSVAPGVHQWLDATTHDDTVTNAPVRGAMGVGNATPAWDILLAGTAHQLLKMNAGGTDPAWSSFDWAAVAAAVAADMEHDHSAAAEGGQNLRDIQEMQVAAATELTIAAGIITRTQAYHSVDTQDDDPSDDLDTINGGTEGDLLIIRAEDSARTVVVKTGTGNIVLSSGSDISLEDDTDHLLLVFDGANWCDDYRVAGGGGGAPVDAEYLTLALDAGLTAERRFVPGAWLAGTDGGAGGDYNLHVQMDLPTRLMYATGEHIEYATIQLALTACAQGDVVYAPPGLPVENLTWPAQAGVVLAGFPVVRTPLTSNVYGTALVGTISIGDVAAVIQNLYITGNITLNGASSDLALINCWCWGDVVDGGTAGDLKLQNTCIDGDVDVDNLDILGGWITGTRTVAGATTFKGEVLWAETVGDHTHAGVAGDGGVLGADYINPAGMIVLWSGAIVDIPTGWVICDGTSSTPDLRDRFVVGAGSTYAVGATGGAATMAHTHAIDHNHPIKTSSASSATDTGLAGSHFHYLAKRGPYTSRAWTEWVGHGYGSTSDEINSLAGHVGGGGGTTYIEFWYTETQANHQHTMAHTHTVDLDNLVQASGAASNTENRPPYYALAYIMKT